FHLFCCIPLDLSFSLSPPDTAPPGASPPFLSYRLLCFFLFGNSVKPSLVVVLDLPHPRASPTPSRLTGCHFIQSVANRSLTCISPLFD
ncbi:hypothetical protein Csa_006018, partial [Cucumis sativus]